MLINRTASLQLVFKVTRQKNNELQYSNSTVVYNVKPIHQSHPQHRISKKTTKLADKRSFHETLSSSERAEIKYNALVRVRKGALHCKYQCVKERRTCRKDCRDGIVKECKLTRTALKSSQSHRLLLCGNDNAHVLYPRPNYYQYCSGGCSSSALSIPKTRYAWFAAQNNLPRPGCSPTGFRHVKILCSLNGHLFNRMVKDFFIQSCGCGVVRTID